MALLSRRFEGHPLGFESSVSLCGRVHWGTLAHVFFACFLWCFFVAGVFFHIDGGGGTGRDDGVVVLCELSRVPDLVESIPDQFWDLVNWTRCAR